MATQASQYELYRNTSLGHALTETLDELISNNQIEPQLAIKILEKFDKCFSEIIAEKVKSRLSFKGSLATYRFCDDVWTFLLKDVNFKLENQQHLKADSIKIVSCTNKKAGSSKDLDSLLKEQLKDLDLDPSAIAYLIHDEKHKLQQLS